jgi:hypothetical protein
MKEEGSGLLHAVDHPRLAVAVDQHAPAVRPERFGDRHLHLATFGQRGEHAFGFFDAVDVDIDGGRATLATAGPSAAITMALPISSWLCATWSRVSGGISLQPGEPSEGGMSRYFISEVTWPPSALA